MVLPRIYFRYQIIWQARKVDTCCSCVVICDVHGDVCNVHDYVYGDESMFMYSDGEYNIIE